jgi:hypothetical protein
LHYGISKLLTTLQTIKRLLYILRGYILCVSLLDKEASLLNRLLAYISIKYSIAEMQISRELTILIGRETNSACLLGKREGKAKDRSAS